MRKSVFFICITLIICILFSSCNTEQHIIKSSTDIVTVSSSADKKYHTASGDTISVSKSSFAELLFDKNTYTVSVRDITANAFWRTLPTESNTFANAFDVILCTGSGVYSLNTQDDSVALNAASFETENGKLKVNYILSDSPDTAKKNTTELTQDDIYVSFTVEYSLSEQSMTVNIDLSSAVCTPGGFISDISVMPYFGSYFDTDANDWIFVPDGPGALMHTSVSDAQSDKVTVKVYGSDSYFESGNDSARSSIPVFGIKHGKSAFAAVITDGDALSTINAARKYSNIPAYANASFNITPVSETETDEIIYGRPYSGNITLVYKFLSEKNATYAAMATAAREEFISCGTMSSAKVQTTQKIPIYLTIAGVDNGDVLTTADSAIDILSILRDKGIDKINLNCVGFLSGGIEQKNLASAKLNSGTGGKNALQRLHDYTSGQNNIISLGINVMSYSKGGIINNSVKTLAGSECSYSMINPLGYKENTSNKMLTRIGKTASDKGKEVVNPTVYTSSSSYDMNTVKLSSAVQNLNSFLTNKYSKYTDGYFITDAGRYLCSDSETNRQEAKNIMSELIRTVPAYGKLTVDCGNIYAVYGASLVTNMDFNTYYPESDAYEPVPFNQTVLHGYAEYTGYPVDPGDPLYRYDMLRSIEYGALPSFLLVGSENSAFCHTSFTSSDTAESFLKFYNDAADILSSLTSETITAHEKITKDTEGNTVTGIYKTTYSNGTAIYVNYSGADITTPDNIVVGANSYVKVTK